MSVAIEKTDKADNRILPDEKLRRCLMCGHGFQSSGPGNRICKKCKSTQAWRQG